ncbi:LytR/AlgR family response regulator transcription factor [Mesoterricola silvestris]|uniref:DNA-binding response regulator n=1 Tax=Mesoterricola silvestris TaxID=2927979 RepID=A0AA48H645_9BACT|nr:LytTR family DNA-binding domain-containing protein [Mesoterricola silvestris]BDU72543.1 DNA-binding response regulator [Mesoterricola silvestris]
MKPNGHLRVAQAEDEPLARKRLGRMLQEAGCDVVAELNDGPALMAWLHTEPDVDALFLDIYMPGASSFEVIGELGGLVKLPPLVFVTAHPEHSLRAFDVAAVDYLLKPVDPERLARTLHRLRQGGLPRTLRGEAHAPAALPNRFPARAGEGHVFLDLKRVSHFEVVTEVAWAWAQGKRYRTSWRSLAEVENAFPGARFIRIQRHILLRPEAVLALRAVFGGRAEVRVGEGLDLEVSRTATPKLKELLGM